MHLLRIISLGLLTVYTLRIIYYLIGWYRTGKTVQIQGKYPGVSVVIPVRNEEANIGFSLTRRGIR